EMFGFTTFTDSSELSGPEWRTAPSMVQWAVPDKTDLRVTVLGERVFAVEILVDGHGVNDDWRLHKKQTAFVPHELPTLVASQCVEIVAALGLRFGAVDLALTGGDYYFLEINPTGEWAWLVDAAGLPIDEVFADELAQ
ncbi:MAG: RimK-like protein, partial [Coriobacteriia bacterium]|nr:RimK-like protein [Coriobacteriia bacterium]